LRNLLYASSAQRQQNKKKNKKNTQTRARALFSVFFFEKCGRWWVRFVVWSAYKETLFFFSWCVLWGARKAQKERKYLSTGNLNSIQNPKLLFSAKMELMCSPQRTYHLYYCGTLCARASRSRTHARVIFYQVKNEERSATTMIMRSL